MCKNGWNQILDSPITNKILHFLEREYKNNIPIFPTQENVFNAFKECAYKDLRVVMLGQDPYPQPGYATGLLFANPIGTKELSPSLKLVIDRIYKDFYLTEPEKFYFDITMKKWAHQGILLLNSALTVVANTPTSHSNLWFPFIKDILVKLSRDASGIIYLLIGSYAKLFEPFINHNTNYVLCYKHPAYFARTNSEFECDGFLKTNEILSKNNGLTIEF